MQRLSILVHLFLLSESSNALLLSAATARWSRLHGSIWDGRNQDNLSLLRSQSLYATKESIDSGTAATSFLRKYEHDGWNLTYLYKPATSKRYQNEPPLLLVHPVGIGISSWFWERFMEAWQDGPALYAVDLIGCGAQHGADAWDPNQRGLFIPLGWVKACEAVMSQQQQLPYQKQQSSFSLSSFFSNSNAPFTSASPSSYSVVVQGGLAPVGVLLASRNPQTVQRLILTSPPTWREMTTPVPEKELATNYNFLKSPLGALAFKFLLESRGAVKFFSNLFLFANKSCDETWISNCLNEACEAVRPPVQVFNAGFCFNQSYQDELQTQISQPVLILQGDKDERTQQQRRQEYVDVMANCSLQTIAGKNVLPWESPLETVAAVRTFCGMN
jgi:pimeloyl-ACP methyl ester carboxylesterase